MTRTNEGGLEGVVEVGDCGGEGGDDVQAPGSVERDDES
jgi:hypothetical protein